MPATNQMFKFLRQKRRQQIYLIFSILLSGCVLISCQGPSTSKSEQSEVSHNELDTIELPNVELVRFDQALDSLNSSNALEKHLYWKIAYGYFYADFLERILKIGAVDDDERVARVLGKIADSGDFRALSDSVGAVFNDAKFDEVASEIEKTFKRIRYHFPEAPIPQRIVTFFSGFALQLPVGEEYYGVGLDMFLGGGSSYYPALVDQYPLYISQRFTPNHILPSLFSAYVESEFLSSELGRGTLLDQMIAEGKRLVLLDAFLPSVADSLKIGYTEKQLAWARHFEEEVWKWFVDEELLYESDRSLSQRYFGEAPFTLGMGEGRESAPRLGMFVGWQIVKSYMKLHPETSLDTLLEMKDAQEILRIAKYTGR